MIVSETLSRLADRGTGVVSLALLQAVLLWGCGSPAPPESDAQALPPPQPARAETSAPAPAAARPTGLIPLPTPDQVVSSVAVGRGDPFGPMAPARLRTPPPGAAAPGSSPSAAAAGTVPAGAAQPAPPLRLPSEFRLAGVIRSGGQTQAVVEFGPNSGSVRTGDRGGRTTDLLPNGWTVAAIDVNQGRILLRYGSQSVTAKL